MAKELTDAGCQDRAAGASKWWVLATVCFAVFMVQLDATIVNIAIPSIMTGLKADISQAEWILNAYILVFASLLITVGRLGDIFGRRLAFLIGLIIFTLASVLCGLAPNIEALIVFRVLQGFGGAIMMPATLSIIAATFPAGERGAAMGIWGSVTGIAAAVGPTLGGFLTESSSWRYIFLINVPVGIIGLIACLIVVRESTDPTATRELDIAGVVSVSLAVFCLTFALVEGQNYGWTSTTIVGLLLTSIAGFIVFVAVELRARQPLMRLSLFRNIAFTAGNLMGMIVFFGSLGVFFLLTLFLQSTLGYSPFKAGLAFTPMPLATMLAAPVSGKLSDKVDARWILCVGSIVLGVGIYFLTKVTPTTTWQELVLPLVLCGLGMGITISPMTAAVMASVPTAVAGNASGVLSTMRQIGSVLGISVCGAVLQNRMVVNMTAVVQGLPGLSPEMKERIISAGTSGGPGMTAHMPVSSGPMADQLHQLFAGAMTKSINTTFMVGVVACLAGAVIAIMVRSSNGSPGQRS